MFDMFDGEINGQNIYDVSSLDQDDYYCDIPDQMDAMYEHNLEMSRQEKQEPAPKILEGEIKRETDKAILFKFGESENWMPKSQVKIKKKKEGCSVEIPDWLWKKMNSQIEG